MASPTTPITQLKPAVDAGIERAQAGISGFLGRSVQLTGAEIRLQPVLASEQPESGDDEEVAAIYLFFQGDLRGHCLLCFDRRSAAWLAGQILGIAPEEVIRGWTAAGPEPMPTSALMEFGNITVSGFLNGLADFCGLAIAPTPPAMAVDYLAAAVNFVLASLSVTTDTAMIIGTHFEFPGQAGVRGTLLLLPETASLQALYAAAARGVRP